MQYENIEKKCDLKGIKQILLLPHANVYTIMPSCKTLPITQDFIKNTISTFYNIELMDINYYAPEYIYDINNNIFVEIIYKQIKSIKGWNENQLLKLRRLIQKYKSHKNIPSIKKNEINKTSISINYLIKSQKINDLFSIKCINIYELNSLIKINIEENYSVVMNNIKKLFRRKKCKYEEAIDIIKNHVNITGAIRIYNKKYKNINLRNDIEYNIVNICGNKSYLVYFDEKLDFILNNDYKIICDVVMINSHYPLSKTYNMGIYELEKNDIIIYNNKIN